jgi:hypothetical protein
MDNESKWLYIDGSGNQKGPIPSNIMLRLLEKGINISADTMIWTQGMGQWDKLRDVSFIFILLICDDNYIL